MTVDAPTYDLYCRYPHQTSPQPCHVYLDAAHERLGAEYDSEIGNAVPMAVHHGHVCRWSIPALRDAAVEALLAEIVPLAERVIAGYESVWDGHNNVARYDADATDAISEIEALCEAAGHDEGQMLMVWQAADWLAGLKV